MSHYPLLKAFSLVIILLINVSNIYIFAQNQTTLTLKNNTDFPALFCINDIYKNTILPKSQVSVLIPTGNQKIDLIVKGILEGTVSCNYNYALTDKNGLPAHDDYLDNFYDHKDYFYTLNQSTKTITNSTTSYQIVDPVVSPGVTAIDLSVIPVVSEFLNTQLCIDGVITNSSSANNLISITSGVHKLSLVSTITSDCVDPDSTAELIILADNTYKYMKVINNAATNQIVYEAVADFKVKPQTQQQNNLPISVSPSTPIPTQQEKKSAEELNPTIKKEPIKNEKIEEKKLLPLPQLEKVPELIKYDKLTIDRASKDKIEDGMQPADNQSGTTSPNKNNTSTNSKVEWSIISAITTILYLVYDIMLYLWKKSSNSFAKIRT